MCYFAAASFRNTIALKERLPSALAYSVSLCGLRPHFSMTRRLAAFSFATVPSKTQGACRSARRAVAGHHCAENEPLGSDFCHA